MGACLELTWTQMARAVSKQAINGMSLITRPLIRTNTGWNAQMAVSQSAAFFPTPLRFRSRKNVASRLQQLKNSERRIASFRLSGKLGLSLQTKESSHG